ncbi:glycosyltransferase [Candidatus Fermentibacteria bacterium]|nr:glycosyltransferase [Candidatus Fermentibacteria bacterium]
MSSSNSRLRGIQFDRYQRLAALARLVEKTVAPGGRVLDVGGHPCELRFFLPDYRVVVADLPRDGAGWYVCADGVGLPFADARFDAVVNSDVLEHTPAAARMAFAEELFRVSRHWVFLGVPRGDADVHAAESCVDQYYRMLHGKAHPWLADHFAFGVPDRAEVECLLRACGARFARFPNGYLPRWTPAMLMNRYLETTEQAELALRRFNTAYNDVYAEADSAEPAYRDIYVATRGAHPLPRTATAEGNPGMDPLYEAFLRSTPGSDFELPDRPAVTVVVVTYNHGDRVEECIRAVAASVDGVPEIIVVDNGSRDESARRAHAAGAMVARTGRNLGFAAAFNIGWRLARGEVIVSINPDVLVFPDALRELVQACLEDEDAVVVGATLWDERGRFIQHAGGEILPNYCTRHLGRGEASAPVEQRDVDYVTGALMAVKRRALQMRDGLDESYWPAYYEETDFCVWARAQGFRVLYWPWAAGRHAESTTLGAGSRDFYSAYHHGRLRFVASHLTWRDLKPFLKAERAFRAGRSHEDVEMAGLRRGWRGWWWRLPWAAATRLVKGRIRWRRL